MTAVPRVSSARVHRSSSAAYGAGGRAVADYLRSHAGDDYAVLEVERVEGRFSLILDAEWVQIARSTHAISEELVADIELPRNTVLAVVAGWRGDWSIATSDLTVDYSSDQIPHLRLTRLRPSPSGAERNARPQRGRRS